MDRSKYGRRPPQQQKQKVCAVCNEALTENEKTNNTALCADCTYAVMSDPSFYGEEEEEEEGSWKTKSSSTTNKYDDNQQQKIGETPQTAKPERYARIVTVEKRANATEQPKSSKRTFCPACGDSFPGNESNSNLCPDCESAAFDSFHDTEDNKKPAGQKKPATTFAAAIGTKRKLDFGKISQDESVIHKNYTSKRIPTPFHTTASVATLRTMTVTAVTPATPGSHSSRKSISSYNMMMGESETPSKRFKRMMSNRSTPPRKCKICSKPTTKYGKYGCCLECSKEQEWRRESPAKKLFSETESPVSHNTDKVLELSRDERARRCKPHHCMDCDNFVVSNKLQCPACSFKNPYWYT